MSEFSRNLAFIVGINNYTNGISPLQNAVNDAKKLVEILREKHEYQVFVCLDEVATLKNLNQLLEKTLAEQVSENDRLLFYFAGHGIALNGDDGPTGYLIPQDAKLNATETYLPMTKLQESLEKLPCRHFLGILDCCFAGAFRWSTSTRDLLTTPEVIHRERYDRFITDPAWQVITSAAYDQKALDAFVLKSERGQVGNHSPFAAALIEALAGKADAYPPSTNGKPPGDGVITATELYLYLRDAVEPATEGNRQRQTPGIWPLKKHDKGEYIFLTPGHELNLPPAPPLDAAKNPYRGLESYDEEHSELFFGRSKLVEKLHQFVKSHPLTVVLGASGSGKSSLVKAGLIPQLRQDNTEKWEILEPIRPGETPLQALNNALKKAQLPEIPAQNPEQNLAMSIDAWAKNHPKSKLLLFIDQSEEVITLCQNEDERKQFFQEILTAINAHRDKLRVVLSLRSDFEPQIRDAGLKFVPTNYNAGNTELKSRWYSGRFIVPAMTRGELREAIEKPAETRVMYFQPYELVEQLIDEVADMPGALPLLSFALSELYLRYLQRQGDAQIRGITIDRALTQADYQDLGGVIQSLTQKADAEYEALVQENPAYAQIIRQVMLRMVALGGGELARRRVPLSELEYPPPKHDLVKEVIERFTKARLLVTGEDAEGNNYVEPAHDALVRGWQKLLGWKQEDEQILVLQRRLTPEVQEWANFKNQDKEQQQGILDKAAPVLVALDRILLPIENSVNKIPEKLYRRLGRDENQQGQRRNKSTEFLWDTDPYLEVLHKELNSNKNWLNQLETEFVQKSLLQKRQNHSWRWRIALGALLLLSGTTIIAINNAIDARNKLLESNISLVNNLFTSGRELDALVKATETGEMLKNTFNANEDIKIKVLTSLQQVVYRLKERNRLQGNEMNFSTVSFSPDGKIIAAAGSNGTIKLWYSNGKLFQTLTQHQKDNSGNLFKVIFSSKSQTLISASYQGINIWQRQPDGKFTFYKSILDPDKIMVVALSPDEKTIATAGLDRKSTIKLWSLDGKLLKTFQGHSDRVNDLSFSKDGQTIASASTDKTIKLWRSKDAKLINTISESSMMFAVRFINNQNIAYAGANRVIKLWNLKEGKTQMEFPSHHSDDISRLVLSHDGKMIASASDDRTVIIWSLEGKPLHTLRGHQGSVTDISFSPNSKIIASASQDNTLRIWNFDNVASVLKGDSLSFSPNGQMIVTGENETISIWQVNGRLLKKFLGHDNLITKVSLSPNGQVIASASADQTVKLWDLDGKLLHTLRGHKDSVTSVSFSPDSKMIASASGDQTVKLWNLDGKLLYTLRGHKDSITSVSFSPDSKMIASGSRDSTVKLWDLNGKLLHTITGHTKAILDVSFSPNGKMIASASEDKTVILWHLNTILWHLNVQQTKVFPVHKDDVFRVKFSPNGQTLASASKNEIKLWNLDGDLLLDLHGHEEDVLDISFSPDGKTFVSSDFDKVIVWNFDLDKLLERSCSWLHDYLIYNQDSQDSIPNVCKHSSYLPNLWLKVA
ncbi:hypothetical protein HCG51_03230 [Tolypothrix sp. PCC 7910]|uniref:nSTAND1 domain-containing NTPase n=1 Tax=Tolypothrix sp. PCC 7910 TaxID=2099387 RepID=UPI00142799DF|nr:caspase family protein [Tolypothrix sp. PCC 7910]QIR35864.1 hypothetical protein HCG51_03230 [Tolypothrix sp. PCC 7910]